MSTGAIDIIKRAARELNDRDKPCDLRYGTVISTSPLKVRITQELILPESVLIVPEHLTDHEIEITVRSDYGWNTQSESGGSGDAEFASHNHDITLSKRKMFIHGALKKDDKVALIRQSGGQYFFILDRIRGD